MPWLRNEKKKKRQIFDFARSFSVVSLLPPQQMISYLQVTHDSLYNWKASCKRKNLLYFFIFWILWSVFIGTAISTSLIFLGRTYLSFLIKEPGIAANGIDQGLVTDLNCLQLVWCSLKFLSWILKICFHRRKTQLKVDKLYFKVDKLYFVCFSGGVC